MALELAYFPIPGRAELIRLALSYGKIAFEDSRIGAEWPGMKAKTPLGQLPVMSLEGKTYCQSIALARYAGRLSGLYPTDALEALKVDQLMESMREVHTPYYEIQFMLQDEAEKAAKSKVFLETTLPHVFGYLDTKVEGKFFLGDMPTLADFQVFDLVENDFVPLFKDIGLSKYPEIASIVKNVKALPAVAAYYAKSE